MGNGHNEDDYTVLPTVDKQRSTRTGHYNSFKHKSNTAKILPVAGMNGSGIWTNKKEPRIYLQVPFM